MPTEPDWEAQCAALFERYEPLRGFFETWGATSGGKKAFKGQLCAMLVQVLAIDADDSTARVTKPMEVLQALCLTIEEDFLLALRFLYYVKAKPVVPDAMYDAAERDFIDRPTVEDSALMNPGSDNPDDYPGHVRALAFYLSMMGWQRGQEAGRAEAAKTPKVEPQKPKVRTPGAVHISAHIGDLFPET